ncbi:MAG: dTMP kinase [Acidimicrobiia bacterium]
MSIKPGKFVTIEGADGTGKSTQARVVAALLNGLYTAEPGGTPFGEQVRDLVLHGDNITPITEMLLFAASRAEHVETVIKPALASGTHVICDRFSWSTLAYQGFGHRLPLNTLTQIDAVATGGLIPDLIVVLDVPAHVSIERLSGRGAPLDRLERLGDSFQSSVREGFRRLHEEAANSVLLDGTGTPSEVTFRILEAVSQHLSL